MAAARTRARLQAFGWVLLGLWVVAFAGAFVAFALTPARDFGLAAGANRILVFFGWQAAAAVIALLGLVLRSSLPRRSPLRRILLMPSGILLALVLALALLLFWADRQPPRPTPKASVPATAPSAPVSPG